MSPPTVLPPRVSQSLPTPYTTISSSTTQHTPLPDNFLLSLPVTRGQSSSAHRYPLRRNHLFPNYKSIAAKALLAQHIYDNHLNNIYDDSGKKLTLSKLLKGPSKHVWSQSLSNELGRLSQGNNFGVKFNDCMHFVHHHEVPSGKKVTYASFVCDHRPLKTEPWRVRLVVGGDQVNYAEDTGSPTTDLIETKILINSVISDSHKGARFLALDLKDFFLSSIMTEPEYMFIHRKFIPPDICERYNLHDKFHNDHIYCKITKGMYGLPQAALLAYDQLQQHLKKFGYHPIPSTVGMFKHVTRHTVFCLCVDDFGVKYYNKEDADHLINALSTKYDCSIDWDGKNFCGLEYKWDYKKQFIDVSLPKYVKKALQRLQHRPSSSPQYSPQHHHPINYSSKGTTQFAMQPDASPLLSPNETKWVQSVVGSFLYYSRALDSTLLTALNHIGTTQANPTQLTKQDCTRLMDYVSTYPDAYIRFHASKMILHIDSDASYLVLPKAKSRIAGYFYLSDLTPTSSTNLPPNGPILVECKTIKHVVTSAAEAEISALFHNARTAIPLRRLLIALGHPQPPTPIKVDNSTANAFVHNNITQRRSKSWDMRFHWLRDPPTKQQIGVYWDKGTNNWADYYTKTHTTPYHRTMRPNYIHDKPSQ